MNDPKSWLDPLLITRAIVNGVEVPESQPIEFVGDTASVQVVGGRTLITLGITPASRLNTELLSIIPTAAGQIRHTAEVLPNTGKGGGAWVAIADTTTADNGGTVRRPNASWIWKKQLQDGAMSVMDFGADGGGVVDDTAAIDATIAAVVALPKGGIAFFPEGTYKYTGTLTLTSGKVKLHGVRNSTRLKFVVTGPGLVVNCAGAKGPDLKDLIIEDGGSAMTYGLQSIAWGWASCDHVRVVSATTEGFHIAGTVCVTFESPCVSSNVENCTPRVAPMPPIGMHFTGSGLGSNTQDTINDPIMEGCIGDGIKCTYAEHCLIAGGTSEGNGGIGINLLAGAKGNIIEAVHLESNTGGNYQDAGNRNTIHRPPEDAFITSAAIQPLLVGEGVGGATPFATRLSRATNASLGLGATTDTDVEARAAIDKILTILKAANIIGENSAVGGHDWDMSSLTCDAWLVAQNATLTKQVGPGGAGIDQCLRIAYNGVNYPGASQPRTFLAGHRYRVQFKCRGDGTAGHLVNFMNAYGTALFVGVKDNDFDAVGNTCDVTFTCENGSGTSAKGTAAAPYFLGQLFGAGYVEIGPITITEV
jgi:hypothetical protein